MIKRILRFIRTLFRGPRLSPDARARRQRYIWSLREKSTRNQRRTM